VITDAKKTIMSLKWAAKEMDRRYDILEKHKVRDIASYHENIYAKNKKDETIERMPYIVIIIDELADIMQAYPRELESGIVTTRPNVTCGWDTPRTFDTTPVSERHYGTH
jgi:S-DNA-T family DNA segregation ATPase FtsK/SpoIIIE